MENEIIIHNENDLKNKIYVVRGVQVMLDSDLAEIYGYEVRALNQQVKRNINRFPADFMFQLTREEIELVKSQIVISRKGKIFEGQDGGTRKLPYAFTEQGIYMLATVLRGELAEQQSIFIMRAFREMKQFFINNVQLFAEIDGIKKHLLQTDINQKEADKKNHGAFYFDGQIQNRRKAGHIFSGTDF